MGGNRKKDNWFSNFKKCEKPIIYQGIIYRTVENFFQAMKTFDVDERQKIAEMTPGRAKKYCNTVVELRGDWESVKVGIMFWALRQKFHKSTRDFKRLIETGNDPIIEFNYWHDNFWGHCTCQKCANKTHQNHLGRLLMVIRDEKENKK